MRKVLKSLVSLLVIATMLLSMASVSFASNEETPGEIILSTDGIKEVTFEDETFTGVVVTASAVVPAAEFYAGWDEGKVSYNNSLFEFVGMEPLGYLDMDGNAHEWLLSTAADNASAGEVNVGVGIGNDVKADVSYPCDADGSGVAMVNLYFKVKADVVADGQEATFTPYGSLVYFDYEQEDWDDAKAVFGAMSTTATGATVTFPEAAPAKYTITYVIDGATIDTQEYEEGQTIVALEAPAKGGFTFDGWVGLPADMIMPADNIVVTGSYTEIPAGVETYNAGLNGNNVILSLDLSTGAATLTGSGAMAEYNTVTAMPWAEHMTKITSLVISDGITTIGKRAFYGATALKEIDMTLSVTKVGSYAFQGTEIDTVTATGTKEQLIAMEVTGDQNAPFLQADWTVTEPSGNVLYASNIGLKVRWIYDTDNAKLDVRKSPTKTSETVTMDGFGDAGYKGAPWYPYMDEVKEIEFTGISTIVGGAFKLSPTLEKVILGEGTTDIWANAFAYNEKLNTIEFPATISKINSMAFFVDPANNNLTNISFNMNIDGYDNITLGSNHMVFKKKLMTFNDGYRGYHSDATYWSVNKNNGLLTLINTNPKNGSMVSGTQPWLPYKDIITSVVVEEYAKEISPSAFSDLDKVTSVTIPSTVTRINARAFQNMTSLEEIVLPDSVTSTGTQIFNGCTNLKSVKLSNSLTTINQYTFANCSSLESIVIPKSVTTIASNAFPRTCSALTDIYYEGTEEEFANITIESSNAMFNNAKKHFNYGVE